MQVGARHHHVGVILSRTDLNSNGLAVFGQDLGYWRRGVNFSAVGSSKASNGFNQGVETTLRVKDSLVHIHMCHQVIHARGVVRRCSQKDCWEVQHFLEAVILYKLTGEVIKGCGQKLYKLAKLRKHLRVQEGP